MSEPTAYEQDHDRDPRDLAGSFVLLDDGEVQVGPIVCRFCHAVPCECELDPITQREWRDIERRYEKRQRWQS